MAGAWELHEGRRDAGDVEEVERETQDEGRWRELFIAGIDRPIPYCVSLSCLYCRYVHFHSSIHLSTPLMLQYIVDRLITLGHLFSNSKLTNYTTLSYS